MRINSIENKINKNISKTKQYISPTGQKQKKYEKSSLDILSNYGMANINFKGNNTIIPQYRELSDDEFKEYLEQIKLKIDRLPENLKQKMPDIDTINKESIFVLDKILSSEYLYANENFARDIFGIIECSKYKESALVKYNLLDKILANKDLCKNPDFMCNAGYLIYSADTMQQYMVAKKILENKQLYENKYVRNEMAFISTLVYSDSKHAKLICDLLDKIIGNNLNKYDSFMMYMPYIIANVRNDNQAKIANKILSDKRLYTNPKFLLVSQSLLSNYADKDDIIELLSDEEILPEQIYFIYKKNLSLDDIKKLNKKIGFENASKLNEDTISYAIMYSDICNLNTPDQIPPYKRKVFLRNIMRDGDKLLKLKPGGLDKIFPLLPFTQESYCALIPKLISSINLKEETLTDSEINDYNIAMEKLGNKLSCLSDDEFNNLKITQEYSKDEFIKDVLDVTKDLSDNEQQTLLDNFGFEINKNEETKTGYSIYGYPDIPQYKLNLKDSAILKIKELVEKFNNSKIICTNKNLEIELNKIIGYMPELRVLIGKVQSGNTLSDGRKIGHGAHDFDVFKHSVKVMQKIAQNPEFNKLDNTDRKILLLASLLHDTAKKEGCTDPVHAQNSAFDSFFITKKLKLSEAEQEKLFTLIKTHEWLGIIRKSKDKEELANNLIYTAYDLRHNNMLDLSLIFTHADLEAVKKDGAFHNYKDEFGKTNGNYADIYAAKIASNIKKINESQPILPVTKIPTSSRINEAIEYVNQDGSTNLKGIYKDKEGLIVINYNEVENSVWEKIGFKKGTISKGIKTVTNKGEKVNTGNIKFFAHGLEDPNQIVNFDAFSFVDSDALLSVSYAERPESKFRFFKPQGLILNCNTNNIHGGGKTDSGSGTKKTIQKFKEEEFKDNKENGNRNYISNLIKSGLNLNTAEYVKFVAENKNKQLTEIEPPELRKKLIEAFVSINSNARQGEREYNEMYISNPDKPMAVYAYSYDSLEKIKNPIDFLNRSKVTEFKNTDEFASLPSVYDRTLFLRKYALKNDIPFFVFGK